MLQENMERILSVEFPKWLYTRSSLNGEGSLAPSGLHGGGMEKEYTMGRNNTYQKRLVTRRKAPSTVNQSNHEPRTLVIRTCPGDNTEPFTSTFILIYSIYFILKSTLSLHNKRFGIVANEPEIEEHDTIHRITQNPEPRTLR